MSPGCRSRDQGRRSPSATTIASENARAFTMFSAMVMLPDVPEEYIKKADMFEFIQKMPTTWDDTRILHGVLPEYITTARRSGAEWFVCSVTNETARTLSIDMDFLDSGTTYDVTYYEDDHDDPTNPTHYINNSRDLPGTRRHPDLYRQRRRHHGRRRRPLHVAETAGWP